MVVGYAGSERTASAKAHGEEDQGRVRKQECEGPADRPRAVGYRYVGDKRSGETPEIDPETVAVVRRIFDLYASGDHSTRTIADTLNTERVPPPIASKGKWMGDSVGYLLQNVANIGKTYNESRLKRIGDLIPAMWPAIITEPLFSRVQERLKSKRPTIIARRNARPFTFRGLLWCTHCHRRLTSQFSGGHAYYRCGSYEWPTAERCSLATRAIREDELLPWVDLIMDGFELGKLSGKWLLKTGAKVDKETATEVIAKLDRRSSGQATATRTRN